MAEVDVYTGHGSQPAIAGRLSASQQQHIFSYRHDAHEALSLTMPLRHESYSYGQLHPIFQMNLSEPARFSCGRNTRDDSYTCASV